MDSRELTGWFEYFRAKAEREEWERKDAEFRRKYGGG